MRVSFIRKTMLPIALALATMSFVACESREERAERCLEKCSRRPIPELDSKIVGYYTESACLVGKPTESDSPVKYVLEEKEGNPQIISPPINFVGANALSADTQCVSQDNSPDNKSIYLYLYELDNRLVIEESSFHTHLSEIERQRLLSYIERTVESAQQIDARLEHDWGIPPFCDKIEFRYVKIDGEKQNTASNSYKHKGLLKVQFNPVDPLNLGKFFYCPDYVYAHELGHLLSTDLDAKGELSANYLETDPKTYLRQIEEYFKEDGILMIDNYLSIFGFYVEEMFAEKIALQLTTHEIGKWMTSGRIAGMLKERDKPSAMYFFVLVLAREYKLHEYERWALQKLQEHSHLWDHKISNDKLIELLSKYWQAISLKKQF